MNHDRGPSILVAADYVMCKNSSDTCEFLVVTEDDIGESRLTLNALTTSTTVKGIMTNHAGVCAQSEVLMVRKTSCYRSCCFHHDQYVLGCQGWTKHVLFPQSKGKFLYGAVSNPQDSSKRFTHYFPGKPVQSNTISTSLGSIQPYATITARRLFVHISNSCL